MNTTTLRQQLLNLGSTSGGHKEQADRYRALLEQIFQQKDGSQVELLQQFVEASE